MLEIEQKKSLAGDSIFLISLALSHFLPLKNRHVFHYNDGTEGRDVSKFSSGVATAHVKWNFAGIDRDLSFLGGFVGSIYTEEIESIGKLRGFVRPEVAWWIVEMTSAEIRTVSHEAL